MENFDHGQCDGCRGIMFIGKNQLLCKKFNDGSCPCESCIVKMMCLEGCSEMHKWARRVERIELNIDDTPWKIKNI